MKNNKQQTAVEWLLNAIETKNGEEFSSYYSEFIEQANEMEKEQIKGSWNHGFDWGMMEQSLAEQGAESTLIDAEHYYEQTYG